MNNIFNQFKSYLEQFLLELTNIQGKIVDSKEIFSETENIEKCINYINNLDSQEYLNIENIFNILKETNDYFKKTIKDALEISFKSNTAKFIENEIFLLEALNDRIKDLISSNENIIQLEKQYQEFINRDLNSEEEKKLYQARNDFFQKISNDIDSIQRKINRAHSDTIAIRKTIEKNQNIALNSTGEIEIQVEKLKSLYEDSVLFIEESNNRIYELLSIASNSVINGSYRENSLRELRSADRLRIFAILIMLGIVTFTLFSFGELQAKIIDKYTFILRIFCGLLFSIPAIYLTRESSKHRNNHLIYLQKSLDLAAFEPFIAGVDEEKKKSLKAEMAKRIFFKNQDKDAKESYPVNIDEILKELFSRIEIKNK